MRLQKDFYHQRCLRHERGKKVQAMTYASLPSTLFYLFTVRSHDGLDNINPSNSISQFFVHRSFESFYFAYNECCKN